MFFFKLKWFNSNCNAMAIKDIYKFKGLIYADRRDVCLAIESGFNPNIIILSDLLSGDLDVIAVILHMEVKVLVTWERRYQANCK